MQKIYGPVPKRFWPKVQKGDGCWLWVASKNGNGYGMLNVNYRPVLAHRISWELSYGLIPEGVHVLHKCDTPHCVRPDHLFLGNHKQNMDDMISKGRSSVIGVCGDANVMRRCPEKRHWGEKNPQAKLTTEQVIAIRARYKEGT